MDEFKNHLAKAEEYGQRAPAATTPTDKSAAITIAQEFLARAKHALDQLAAPTTAPGDQTASGDRARRGAAPPDQCLYPSSTMASVGSGSCGTRLVRSGSLQLARLITRPA